MAGLYIHIPFCSSRCIYCDFYSTTGSNDLQERYVNAILKELSLRKNYLHDCNIETVYIGGGTPTILKPKFIELLCNNLRVVPKEFTIECNPDDITPSLAQTLYKIGINRISMGVQTFSDQRLKFLRRRHNAQQVFTAINILRETGFQNINIDLIFGFPSQTITDWQEDLNTAISLNVEHISSYSLMYEEGTPLYTMLKQKQIKENPEENSVKMFEVLLDKLESANYEHYEISNFAKLGYKSLHNSSYWNGTEYVGLGAAAHSYNTLSRQWNINNLKEYIENIEKGNIPAETEIINDDTRYNDIITTALRTREGINLEKLDTKYRNYIINNAQKSIAAGHLRIEGNQLQLTRQGIFVSDDVMSDLIWI